MRDLNKIKKDEFTILDVKRAYRVNHKKAMTIVEDFIKNNVVEKTENGYRKIKNEEIKQEIKQQPVQEQKVEKQVEEEINEVSVNNETKEEQNIVENKEESEVKKEKDVFAEVAETKIPVPYEVVTDHGTFELRVCNKDELIVVLNRVTGYANYKIESVRCLRK